MIRLLLPVTLLLVCSSCKLIATTSSTTAYNDLDRKWFMMSESEEEQKREFTRFYLSNHQEIKKDIVAGGGEHLNGVQEILQLPVESYPAKLTRLKETLNDLQGDRASSEHLYQFLTH